MILQFHLVSLGVQLAARLLWIIYDDLTYMPGILAYVESGILAEVPGRLDLDYFLSLHLVSGTLYTASLVSGTLYTAS